MTIQTEAFWEAFLKMEQHAAPLIDSCVFNSGINAWGMLRIAFHEAFYTIPNSYVDKHSMATNILCKQTFTLPPKILPLLDKVPSNSCLYLSHNRVHVLHTAEGSIDPYLDPIAFVAQNKGIMPVKLQLHAQGHCHPLIRPLELPFSLKQDWLPLHSVEPFPAFRDYVALSLEHRVPPLHAGALVQYCMEIQDYANLFEQILRRVQPSVVFLICYYSIQQQALSLACYKLGIPCVEYQHGLQTWPHLAYNFQYIPKQGFPTVPQWFFTWGDLSARPYQKIFAGQQYHKVAVAGKADYFAWKQGKIPEDQSMVNALKEKCVGKKVICVPLAGDGYPLHLLPALIVAAPDDWLWLLRDHPLHKSSWLRLPQNHLHKVETQAATALSVHTVLSCAQHIVTACSSTALEAISLHAMQATLIDKLGAVYFSEQVRSGDMYYAATLDEALHSIATAFTHYPHTCKTANITQDMHTFGALIRALASTKKYS